MQYRSARGQIVDVSQIMSNSPSAVSMGNVRRNHQGDLLDQHNRVIRSRDALLEEYNRAVLDRPQAAVDNGFSDVEFVDISVLSAESEKVIKSRRKTEEKE